MESIRTVFTVLIISSFLVNSADAKVRKKETFIKKRTVANFNAAGAKQMSVKGYFMCFRHNNNPQQRKKCVAKFLLESLSQSREDRFALWPEAYRIDFIQFKECSKKQKSEAAYFPLVTIDYECASIEIGGTEKEVTFFFKPGKDQSPKLYSLHY